MSLPDSTLDCILEYLLPVDLCSVAEVCTSLKYRCRSNGLWEKHIKQKWGGLLGDVAYREWQRHVTMIVHLYPKWSPTGGWQLIDENVRWDRLRIYPLETPPHALHIRECLNDLKPGDHIEIQRKMHKDQPYDWYYAVIGHLESCNKEDQNHCSCEYSDVLIVLLNLNKCRPGSPWRRAVLRRNVRGEQGNGFWLYGGIRKLDKEEEIERWNRIGATHTRRDFITLH